MERSHALFTLAGHAGRRISLLAVLAVAIIAAACGPATDDVASVDPDQDVEVEAPLDEDASPDDATADGSDGQTDEPTPAAAPDEPADEPATEPETEDDSDQHTAALTVGFDEHEVTVVATDGSEVVSFGLPDERLDRVTDVVVRPGATATELDAVVVVLRGEVYRLYHLEVTDGQEGVFTAFPDHLQPQDALEAVMTVTWTPDADSLVWTEPSGDGVVLRRVGWDDGPGTDRPADDNASFVLELPADVSIDGFEVIGDDRWTVQLTDGMGNPHEVVMERQADGALALPS